jgi:hypothetical protein
VLLGSSPIAAPRLLHKRAGSEDPSLRRRYPVSTVLRSSPTPVRSDVLATTLGIPDHDRSPPITRVALPACCAHYPGGSAQVHLPGFLPCAVLPSPLHRQVGIRIATFEACSGFTHVTAHWLAQPPKGDLCHKAPARSVTRANRLSATRSNRLLSRWNLPPLATRAYGAHCAKSRCEARQRAQPRGAILRTRSAANRAVAHPTPRS